MNNRTALSDSTLKSSVRHMEKTFGRNAKRVLARQLRHVSRSLQRAGGDCLPHARAIAKAARRIKAL